MDLDIVTRTMSRTWSSVRDGQKSKTRESRIEEAGWLGWLGSSIAAAVGCVSGWGLGLREDRRESTSLGGRASLPVAARSTASIPRERKREQSGIPKKETSGKACMNDQSWLELD